MTKTKLLIIILLAGQFALSLMILDKLNMLINENMACNQPKQDPIFIFLRCLKNSQEQEDAKTKSR